MLVPCSRCGAHARPSSACPSCGAAVGRSRPSWSIAAAVLGLAVAAPGCTGVGKDAVTDTGTVTTVDSPQPAYGVTSTDFTDADTDTDADADADADSDADTDADTDTDTDADTDTGTRDSGTRDSGTWDSGTGGTVEPLYGATTVTK